jgi:hypothetical protein
VGVLAPRKLDLLILAKQKTGKAHLMNNIKHIPEQKRLLRKQFLLWEFSTGES